MKIIWKYNGKNRFKSYILSRAECDSMDKSGMRLELMEVVHSVSGIRDSDVS